MRPINPRRRTFLLAALLFLPLSLARLAGAGEISQYFPADGQEADRETKWRIVWAIEPQGGIGSEVLVIKEAWFSRGPGVPEIKVLGDTRIDEIFTPYNTGVRLYDVSGANFLIVDLDSHALGPSCIVPGQLYDRAGHPAETGPVAAEVHDDHVRWTTRQRQTRRGQVLEVWSVMDAMNYQYVLLYTFRDDGQIGLRLGATGRNLYFSADDETTHSHVGCWRVNVELDNQLDVNVKKVRLDTQAMATSVNGLAREARFKWNPEDFTRLRFESSNLKNGHNPSHKIAYDLIPMASGAARYFSPGEEFTQNDFWVTLDKPGEVSCPSLNTYENNESLNGGKAVVWYLASANHTPRDEDYGVKKYDPRDGVAMTTWAGFDLKPRNFFSESPLYP